MLIEKSLEDITSWVKDNICEKLNLMKPNDENMGMKYEPTETHPIAFTMFIPARELLPPEQESHLPAVCVQMINGADDLRDSTQSINIRLSYAIWAPGEWPAEGQKMKRSAQGWKDAMLSIDKSLRIIESAQYIAGLSIDRNIPVKYGFFDQSETLVNSYPEWYAYITFTLKAGIADRLTSFDKLL